jgi:hypothetical protein
MRLSLPDRALCRIAEAVKDPGMQWLTLKELIPTEDLGTKDFEEVEDLRERMAYSGEWPEKMKFIAVTPSGGRFLVLDGHHRCLAAEAAGIDRIPALIYFDEDHYKRHQGKE